MNIKEQITKLTELQKIDQEAYDLNKKKIELPREIDILDAKFQEKKKTLQAQEDKLKDLQKKRKDKELDLATGEEGIKKLQTQLYLLKTNKEYQTMLDEIAKKKADNSIIEEDIINILDAMDLVTSEINKEKQNLANEEKKFQLEKKIVEEKVIQMNAQIERLELQRKQALGEVDKKILSSYERILKGRDSLAIVSVKNDSCQGCFMSLPPQVINEIKMYEKLITCEKCNRILYIPEDL
ncbi:MAG: C4-type zinc ribbon domain-containing protein [Candidatus Omnitrophota bacterium]